MRPFPVNTSPSAHKAVGFSFRPGAGLPGKGRPAFLPGLISSPSFDRAAEAVKGRASFLTPTASTLAINGMSAPDGALGDPLMSMPHSTGNVR